MTNSNAGNWARSLAAGLITPNQLLKQNLISADDVEVYKKLAENFDIRVPQHFLQGIAAGNQSLAMQMIPDSRELLFLPEELADPIGDQAFSPVKGITHRYPDRALLKLSHQCASYCRFCFRRNKVADPTETLSNSELTVAFDYLKKHNELWEVILTGGDPLVLTDSILKNTAEFLSQIDHIKILRIHTRILTVLPERITESLLEILRQSKKRVYLVAHINHADELTPEAIDAIEKCHKSGIQLLSQNVFLKNINDSAFVLANLYRKLIEIGVKPYYLHYPDLAQGTQHFRVPLQEALEIYGQLRGSLSGICVPQFMLDIPGGLGKIAIEPQRAKHLGQGLWEFTSPLTGELLKVQYPEN